MALESHIQAKFAGRLSPYEAQQYAFTLFCILDCIPAELRSIKWDRERISNEFATLARTGFLSADGDQVLSSEMGNPAYWNQLITDILMKRIPFDLELQKRFVALASQ